MNLLLKNVMTSFIDRSVVIGGKRVPSIFSGIMSDHFVLDVIGAGEC
jgi:hypothetical protein